MKQNLKKLILQKKRPVKSEDIRAVCPQCGKQKPTSKMHKSPVNAKHYCTKNCMDKADRGQKQVTRMRELAGLK